MREGYYKPRPLPRQPTSYQGASPHREPPRPPHGHMHGGPHGDPHKRLLQVRSNQKKKSPNILVLGIIALVILIAIIILLVKIFGGQEPEKQKEIPTKNLEMDISNAFVEDGKLKVVIDVISGESSLDSVKFIIEGNGKQEVFLEDYVSNPEYSFILDTLDFEEIEKISIIPIIQDSKGNINTGPIQDIYYFTYVSDGSDNDTGDLPYDDYLSGGDDDNSSSNCTSNYTYKCYSGDVYWYNSCNYREELKESCSFDETCQLGICVDTPQPASNQSINGCGNNIIEAGEYCDGISLAGETCASFGFDFGTLACNNYCTFDISGCYNSESSENSPECYINSDCSGSETCVSGVCVAPQCVLTSSYYCHDGDVYYYDSCGVPSQVKEYCGVEEVCNTNTNACETVNTIPPPPQVPNIPS